MGADTQEIIPFLGRGVLDGLIFDWYVSEATAKTDIPSEVTFLGEDRVDPVTGEVLSTRIRQSDFAARYRYTDLEDEVDSNGWDITKAFTLENSDIELSFGQDVSQKARSYTQLDFGLGTTEALAGPALVGTPADVFTDAKIQNPINGFQLTAGGLGTESYLAGQIEDGVYFKVDALLSQKWRLSGGVRQEEFEQASLPIDRLQFDPAIGQCALVPCDEAALERIHFVEDELYPAFSGTRIFNNVWAQTFQLRFGASETVARPDLREVSAATYIDPLTEARVIGNPNLVTSPITNFDARAEWFFDNGDNFTASLFYKDIDRPIETVQGAGSDDNIVLTFTNAQQAEVQGIEVEWLKDLSSLGLAFFRPFFFSGNIHVERFRGDDRRRGVQSHEQRQANVSAVRLRSQPTTRLRFEQRQTLVHDRVQHLRRAPVLRRPRRRARRVRATVRFVGFRLLPLPDGPPEREVPLPEPAGRGARDQAERRHSARAKHRHDGEDRHQVGHRLTGVG